GAAARISSLAALAYCSKFFTNEAARFCAVFSNAALSAQAFFGSRISDGTPVHDLGKFSLKKGVVPYSALSNSPLSAAVIKERVYESLILLPTPYFPPTHPVFSSQTFTLFFFNFSPNNSSYFVGCKGKNAFPKQAEKVSVGSVIPISVPATLAV